MQYFTTKEYQSISLTIKEIKITLLTLAPHSTNRSIQAALPFLQASIKGVWNGPRNSDS
jgi:hypothetical protein